MFPLSLAEECQVSRWRVKRHGPNPTGCSVSASHPHRSSEGAGAHGGRIRGPSGAPYVGLQETVDWVVWF